MKWKEAACGDWIRFTAKDLSADYYIKTEDNQCICFYSNNAENRPGLQIDTGSNTEVYFTSSFIPIIERNIPIYLRTSVTTFFTEELEETCDFCKPGSIFGIEYQTGVRYYLSYKWNEPQAEIKALAIMSFETTPYYIGLGKYSDLSLNQLHLKRLGTLPYVCRYPEVEKI